MRGTLDRRMGELVDTGDLAATDRVCAVHFGDCPADDAVFIPAMLAWAEERG